MSIIEKALKSRATKPEAAPGDDARSLDAEAKRRAMERGEDFLDLIPEDAERRAAPEPAISQALDSAEPADTALAGGAGDRWKDSTYGEDGGGSEHLDRPRLEIQFDELQKLGFVSPMTPRSRMAEEFRTIKRPLLKNISGRGSRQVERPNLIMVTSALQGDGKTFTSINLAISIALEQDKTVLFVDADVVRASAGRTLGVKAGTPGLIDLLQDDSDIEPSDVILHTNLPNLRVLPAGNASDKSTELLASSTMHDFMLELSARYRDRVIVFDSPPLLLTTEASVLASFMGQVVFVASADITPQYAVQEALEHIGEDKAVGVVLNRASRRRSKLLGIGSYGYGYGYGYGYDADREGRDAEAGTASP